MAISNVPSLPSNIAIVDPKTGYPSPAFQRWWQDSVQNAVNALVATQNVAQAAQDAQAAATAANTAAAAAQTAADNAQTAGSDAAAAAATAQAQADANAREAALVNSYITPSSVLTCNTTTITIAAHTRNYADGTSLAVSGAAIPVTGGTAPYTNYVSYTDPTRLDTTPPYVATDDSAVPTQSMDVHVVGAITVPAAGTASGGEGPRRPGGVIP